MEAVTDPADIAEVLGIEHFFVDGMYAKLARMKKGMIIEQHVHPYDHESVLIIGTVRLDTPTECGVIRGPCKIKITAGRAHTITALTDALWACVHETEETDPSKVDAAILKG